MLNYQRVNFVYAKFMHQNIKYHMKLHETVSGRMQQKKQ